MTPQRHEHVKKLFFTASGLQGSARAEFLDGSCRDDPALRAEVESLLDHHSRETLLERSPGHPAQAVASSAESTPPPGDLQPRFVAGDVVAGRYRIVTFLGRGAMGEVYRADDLTLHRAVALKFLFPERVSDATWRARFYNEARVALAVTHPHVCRIYDVGEADGEAFISMEFVDGEDLGSLLRRLGRIPPQKAIDITRQICLGLGAAHAQGVVHRDLKPTNVMLDGQGRARLTDFSIAVLGGPPTGPCPVAGTPAYMAPELWRGHPPSCRSDIYAIGLILYEMLTGQRALSDRQPAKRHDDSWTLPAQLAEQLPANVDSLLRCCLADDPANRPGSAFDLVTELTGGDPLKAAVEAGELPAPELIVRSVAGRQRRPTLALSLAAGAVALLTAVVLLGDRTVALSAAGLNLSPEVLIDHSRRLAEGLGYPPGMRAAPSRFLGPWEPQHRDPPAKPTGVHFEACFEETALCARFDSRGRLIRLMSAMPTRPAEPPEDGPRLHLPFELAGLDFPRFQPTPPTGVPPVFADEYLSWAGPGPDTPEKSYHVEAAVMAGRVVYFQAQPAETASAERVANSGSSLDWRTDSKSVLSALFVVTFLAAVVMAWQNQRLRRSDNRSAARLAAAVFCLRLISVLASPSDTRLFDGWTDVLLQAFLASVAAAGCAGSITLRSNPWCGASGLMRSSRGPASWPAAFEIRSSVETFSLAYFWAR